jgi:uncharacterized protein (DUF1684 family)
MKKIFILTILLFIFKVGKTQNESYWQSIKDWHVARYNYLKAPDGWLNLEGLFWLHPGVNSFGSSSKADAHYENSNFPSILGYFILQGDSVLWKNEVGQTILIDKQAYKSTAPVTVFTTKDVNAVMDFANFSWIVIKREDKIGIRFRNYDAALLKTFTGLNYFPTQTKWRVKAKLEKPAQDFIMISNILGQTTALKSAGILHFTIDGKNYSLEATDEGKSLFIAFADLTTGATTYGSGRFIDVEKPDATGYTYIDFNKAYNPPCAFTAFATCPLPPKQNRLSLAILAGEKKYGHN